jgi:hypothetical protein
MLSVFC